jgi:hypothetical protein
MYAANSAETAPAQGNGRYGVSLAVPVAVALVVAFTAWAAMMVAAATAGRLVLELGQWVGELVLEVLGAGIRQSLPAVPHALAQLTSVWPAFHFGQFARYAVEWGGVDLVPHGLSFVVIAVLFCLTLRRGLRNVR